MAYGQKYSFKFQASNGDVFEIAVLKDGYSGSVINRCLGRAPQLRREKNGPICGTSLEIYAQCDVDGEFTEFYTSDPLTWKVRLIRSNSVLFEGFIVPELYSEPDIAPPYDVQVIATDGLGELKRYNYPSGVGELAMSSIIAAALLHTGLSLPLCFNNTSVKPYEEAGVDTAALLLNTKINLDHLEGKTFYEVLSSLLESLGAVIAYQSDHWQLFREADLQGTAVVRYGTASQTVAATQFGSMNSFGWWPVGQMEREVVPASNQIVVISDAKYHGVIKNPDMASDENWTKAGTAAYDSTLLAYTMYGQGYSNYIRQVVNFSQPVKTPLRLRVKFSSEYRTNVAVNSRLMIKVSAQIKDYGSSAVFATRYLTQDENGNTVWTRQEAWLLPDMSTPEYGQGMADSETVEFVLPLGMTNARNWHYAESVTIQIGSYVDSVLVAVEGCELAVADQIVGYRSTFNIDNGARENANDVNCLFLPYQAGQEKTHPDFMYDITRIMRNGVYEIVNLFDQVAEDYARCVSAVRIRRTGKLNVPAGAVIPFAMRDRDGVNYWPETFSWNLYDNEMDVVLLSRPAATVTISSSTQEEITGGSGGSSSGGSSSGGSGGGGGSSQEQALEVFEYTSGHYALRTKASGVFNGNPVTIEGLQTDGFLVANAGGTIAKAGPAVLTIQNTAGVVQSGQTVDRVLVNLKGRSLTVGALEGGYYWGTHLTTYDASGVYVGKIGVAMDGSPYYADEDTVMHTIYHAGNANSQSVNWQAANLTVPQGGKVKLNDSGTAYLMQNSGDDDVYLSPGSEHNVYLEGSATLPGTNAANNLGSASLYWNNVYAKRWYPDSSNANHYIEYDSTNSCFRIHGPLAVDGQVSAGGLISNS